MAASLRDEVLKILGDYLPPDSPYTAKQTISRLLTLMDIGVAGCVCEVPSEACQNGCNEYSEPLK